MGTLIDDVLEYASLKSDDSVLKMVDVTKILASQLHSLDPLIKNTNTEIIVEDLPTLICDQSKLQRLFFNLIENGIKYRSDKPPHITITAEDQITEWLFTIKDNGIGMDQSSADGVFKMFNRLHTSKEYTGTGIGLAICKRIVELHGGNIWVESESGKGSIFYFTITKNL